MFYVFYEWYMCDLYDGKFFYKMDVFGNKMYFKLIRNMRMVKLGLEFEIRYENGDIIMILVKLELFFYGKEILDFDFLVVVSNDKGLVRCLVDVIFVMLLFE